MKKRQMAIIIYALMIFLIVSCSNRKFDMTVESPLEFYTPAISSVPGFPLRVILPDETYYGEYVFKWMTDTGKFIDWGSDGRIAPLGRQAVINTNEIFWSPLEEAGEWGKIAKIEVHAIRLDIGSIDSKKKFNIIQQDDGLYILEAGD